jgi:hypothetical protein
LTDFTKKHWHLQQKSAKFIRKKLKNDTNCAPFLQSTDIFLPAVSTELLTKEYEIYSREIKEFSQKKLCEICIYKYSTSLRHSRQVTKKDRNQKIPQGKASKMTGL